MIKTPQNLQDSNLIDLKLRNLGPNIPSRVGIKILKTLWKILTPKDKVTEIEDRVWIRKEIWLKINMYSNNNKSKCLIKFNRFIHKKKIGIIEFSHKMIWNLH